MKNLQQLIITLSLLLFISFQNYGQVDIQPNALGVNACPPVSELAINDPGIAANTVHIVSTDDMNGSTALYAMPFDVTGFGDFTYGVHGGGELSTNSSSWLFGVRGTAGRVSPSNNGRNRGVFGVAYDATPGVNHGVWGTVTGTNAGAGVLGYDAITHAGWSQITPPSTNYAGYFRGNGYFHDNLGLGILAEEPDARLHVSGGDVYLEGATTNLILTDSTGAGCWEITVDGTGALITTSVACP